VVGNCFQALGNNQPGVAPWLPPRFRFQCLGFKNDVGRNAPKPRRDKSLIWEWL
jgi:hypothetical protein